MAVMKPLAQDAGSRRAFLGRAAGLASAFATVGCGGTARQRWARDVWLEPLFGFSGARLTNKLGPAGYPLPGGEETYIPFMFPAVAVASLDSIFVADTGYGRIFRYVRSTGLMSALPSVRVGPGIRLQVDAVGTVYALDALRGEIGRYAMHGMPMPALHPRLPTSRYLDFALEGRAGWVFAVDALNRVVDKIEPMGRVAITQFDLDATGPIAIDGSMVLIADAQCKCINEWRDGRLARKLAAGQIRLPSSLTAERGEIYVLDGFDRSISRVYEGGLETLMPADIDLVSPEQISVSSGMMYVADGVSRTVAVFRIKRRVQ
jgi:hypothetical protein